MQDEGTATGPSDSLRAEGIVLGDWQTAGGGEAGDFVFDRAEEGVVYAGEYGGIMTRWEEKTGNERNISYYPTNPSGHGAEDLRVRFQWTAPLARFARASRASSTTAPTSSCARPTAGRPGSRSLPTSPATTRRSRSGRADRSPATTPGVEIYDTIFSLAESSARAPAASSGPGPTTDCVHVTRDGGATWTNVTPAGMPEWATVESIALSAGARRHRLGRRRRPPARRPAPLSLPHPRRRLDLGAAVQGLPRQRLRPRRARGSGVPGLLYLGTRFGVFLSRDGGDRWEAFKLNLPPVVVTDLEVKNGDLVVATSGRSLWILDDLSAVRAWSAETAAKPLHLFPPRAAQRLQLHRGWSAEARGREPAAGGDRPLLAGDQSRRARSILEIFDGEGRRVRRLSSIAEAAALSRRTTRTSR